MVRSVITILLGVYFVLVGLGRVKVSKNPDANTKFVQKWGKFYLISGSIIVIAGVIMLVSSF